ncbi:MAG: lipocalin family protein [Alistipes sp.]
MKLLYKFFLMAALATLLTNCGDSKDAPALPQDLAQIAGTWHLTAWSGDSAFNKGVYLDIKSDKTFALYQDIVSHGYQKLEGTFTLETTFDEAGKITSCKISGVYADGAAWAGVYTITEITAEKMKWTLGGTTDVSTYTRTPIPEEVINQTRTVTITPEFRFL